MLLYGHKISDMEKKDIAHLATLARIKLTDEEQEALAGDITNILGYVSEINEITGKETGEKKVGPLHTVMRDDGEPHEGGIYTEDLLSAAPERDGQYVKVKKILNQDD